MVNNTPVSTPVSTPVKRLQDSCQEIAALLSRDCSTPVRKMLEYLNLFLFIHITLLPVHSNKKISHSLKNGRR